MDKLLIDDSPEWIVILNPDYAVKKAMADLRIKIEALRDKWQKLLDRDPDGKLSGYDRAHVAALNDVLNIIEGVDNG
jgi:hypothetical protein